MLALGVILIKYENQFQSKVKNNAKFGKGCAGHWKI